MEKANSSWDEKHLFELGVLKLSTNECNAVNESLLDKFPQCFKGLGKLKIYQAKIHINQDVTPVAQRARRIPFSMRKKVRKSCNSWWRQM